MEGVEPVGLVFGIQEDEHAKGDHGHKEKQVIEWVEPYFARDIDVDSESLGSSPDGEVRASYRQL